MRPETVLEGRPVAVPRRSAHAMNDRPAARVSGIRSALTMGVYHVLFGLAFLIYAPVLLWRLAFDPRYRTGIRERMGAMPILDSASPVVWIHGVSVGEVKAAGTLIARLRAERPDLRLVLSSTTPAGHALARKLHPDLTVVFYPLDFGPFPGRALRRIRPACVLLMELEIWPNFLEVAARRGIPVAVINGRMSEKSFRGYRRLRGLLPQFDRIQVYCVQDASYRRRLLDLGVDGARIEVTGNMKYDSVALRDPAWETVELRRWLSPDGQPVVVAGSTHDDEELRLADLVRRLKAATVPALRLVVAPRHPERTPTIVEALTRAGHSTVRWSETQQGRTALRTDDVLVVDTIGQLETFYGACDVAFVGGSLVAHGGQNMLEPAALGKAVVFGPHTNNFRTDVRLLIAGDAVCQVRDVDQLQTCLADLLRDGDRRRALGDRAVAVIRCNQGATERTLQALRPLLAGVVAAQVRVDPTVRPRTGA